MLALYKQTLIMSIWILAGVMIKKKKWIPVAVEKKFSWLLIYVIVPCAIIGSFVNNPIEIPVPSLVNVFVSVCTSFAILLVIGKGTAALMCKNRAEKGIWEYMVMFSNNIYIGFPVVSYYLGKEGLIYATLICIPCNALMFSYGLMCASADSGGKVRVRNIFNSCTVASLIALALLLFPMRLPTLLERSLDAVGSISSPLGLMLLGFVFAEYFDIKRMKLMRSILFGLIRLFAGALVIAFAYRLFWSGQEVMMKTMVLTAALPATSMSVILCKEYDNPAMELAIEEVAVSTVLFLVTAPILHKYLLGILC